MPIQANPLENGCGRADDFPIHFCNKATFRAGAKEARPIGTRLVPAGNIFQPHPRWDVSHCHEAKDHPSPELLKPDSVAEPALN